MSIFSLTDKIIEEFGQEKARADFFENLAIRYWEALNDALAKLNALEDEKNLVEIENDSEFFGEQAGGAMDGKLVTSEELNEKNTGCYEPTELQYAVVEDDLDHVEDVNQTLSYLAGFPPEKRHEVLDQIFGVYPTNQEQGFPNQEQGFPTLVKSGSNSWAEMSDKADEADEADKAAEAEAKKAEAEAEKPASALGTSWVDTEGASGVSEVMAPSGAVKLRSPESIIKDASSELREEAKIAIARLKEEIDKGTLSEKAKKNLTGYLYGEGVLEGVLKIVSAMLTILSRNKGSYFYEVLKEHREDDPRDNLPLFRVNSKYCNRSLPPPSSSAWERSFPLLSESKSKPKDKSKGKSKGKLPSGGGGNSKRG